MAAQAKYTLHIPQRDNLGNPLRDLATAAHQHLFNNGAIEGSYIERGKDGNWRDDPQEKLDHLVAFADDSPETDSHMKQTAKFVAELANQWGVTVTKEGKSGPNLWIIDHPGFQEGAPADPSAIAAPPGTSPVIPSLTPPQARTASAPPFPYETFS